MVTRIVERKKKKFDMVDAIIDFEGGSPTIAEVLELFSRLIKNGQAWSLQGMYGRQAAAFIEADFINKEGKINYALLKSKHIGLKSKWYGDE